MRLGLLNHQNGHPCISQSKIEGCAMVKETQNQQEPVFALTFCPIAYQTRRTRENVTYFRQQGLSCWYCFLIYPTTPTKKLVFFVLTFFHFKKVCVCFETGSYSMAQAVPELIICLLPQLPKWKHCRCTTTPGCQH